MQILKESIKSIILSLLIVFAVSVVYAWTEPTSIPPAGNTLSPVSIGGGQIVEGGLVLGNSTVVDGLVVKNGNVTIKNGNVGIGTIGTLTEKLEVIGNIKADAFLYPSDLNLKKNVVSLSDQLGKILQLQGVSFDWKKDNKHSIGLIAQEIEKVYPEIVSTNKVTGLKSVEYGNLIAPLIEAVKEQQKQIDALKAEIENLKK